jgi:hypothetical protein
MAIREYLFGAQQGKNGRTLPFTRFDTILSAALALALMIAMAYSLEPQTGLIKRRLMVVLCSIALMAIIAQNRRMVFGCGFGVVTVRFVIAMLMGEHLLVYAGGSLICGAITWFLLRNLD